MVSLRRLIRVSGGDGGGVSSTNPSAWKQLWGDGRRFPPLGRDKLHLLKNFSKPLEERNGLVVGFKGDEGDRVAISAHLKL